MNFQDRLIEASSDLRTRAAALTTAALDVARSRADVAAKRVGQLKSSFATLSVARRELNKVAQRHASRFVKDNAAIAVAAGKDLSAVARSTYASLSSRKMPAKSRKTRAAATRKRATAKPA